MAIDHSQDTNTIQYQLMTYIGGATRCISIVGDPDQSSKSSTYDYMRVLTAYKFMGGALLKWKT